MADQPPVVASAIVTVVPLDGVYEKVALFGTAPP